MARETEHYFRKVERINKENDGEGEGLMDGDELIDGFKFEDYEVIPDGMQTFIQKYFVADTRTDRTSPLFMAQYLLEHGGILGYRDAPIFMTSAKLLALAVVFE